MFKCHLEFYEDSTKQYNNLTAKVATLTEKLNKQGYAKNRIEKVLTYVEEQLTCLGAAFYATPPSTLPAASYATVPLFDHAAQLHSNLTYSAPSSNSSTIARLDNTSIKNHKARIIKIFNLLMFYGNPAIDKISYKDWLL